MAYFAIRTVNSKFVTDTEVSGIETPEAVLALGVRGAVAMAADDIYEGRLSGSVTVTVSSDDRPVLSVAVSLSVAPLFVGTPEA